MTVYVARIRGIWSMVRQMNESHPSSSFAELNLGMVQDVNSYTKCLARLAKRME